MEKYSHIITELEVDLKRISMTSESMLNTAKSAIKRCRVALVELRWVVVNQGFPDLKSEIRFFKKIKPVAHSRLLFYQTVFEIESFRSKYDPERIRRFLKVKLDEIQMFTEENASSVQYYNCGFTYLDSLYFVRKREEIPIELRGEYYLMDEDFNTWQDYNFSVIHANEMLMEYLNQEIDQLDSNGLNTVHFSFPTTKLTWRGTKTELMEQLYSWDGDRTFGDVPLTQLSDYIQNVFNIQLDKNLSRAFSEMKTRNIPTPFLDKLKAALLRRMGRKK